MIWEEVRKAHPNQWIIIEAIEATTEDNRRLIEQISVIDVFDDDNTGALRKYVELHKSYPEKELYVVHTSRSQLDIKERIWTGVRGAQ